MHTLVLVVPVTSVATKDDAVSCSPPLSCLPAARYIHARIEMRRAGFRSRLFFPHSSYSDSVSLFTQVRIMFRKLKESFEKTNAELREELALMHLQCNNRVFFGVGHSVSRLAPALKTLATALKYSFGSWSRAISTQRAGAKTEMQHTTPVRSEREGGAKHTP